jgi:hypothetical protein
MTQKTYLIKALIVDSATSHGLADLHVRAYDKDPVWDDCLGSDDTDGRGACTIRFFEGDFRELFEGEPEVYLVIYGEGNRELHRTKPVRLKPEQITLELRVPISTPRPATPIRISVEEPTPDANSVRVRISIDERALQITRTPFGTRVELPGFYTAGEEGGPGLPARACATMILSLYPGGARERRWHISPVRSGLRRGPSCTAAQSSSRAL